MSLENLSEVQSEKLFWKKVAEEIKETDFRRIYEIIFSDIESGNYVLARQTINEEIKRIIAEKNMAMYSNTGQRGLAIIVLKEEFYKLFPEIEALIEETEEERRAKIKRPSGELNKEEDFEQKWEEEKGKYIVEELEWPVPKDNEFVPGLSILIKDRQDDGLERVDFLEYPRFDENGNLVVKVKFRNREEDLKLADFGLVADTETGLWNSRFKPLLWEIKEKK